MNNIDLEAKKFGEMLFPISVIAEDEEIKEEFQSEKSNLLKIAALIFKKHPTEAVDFVLAYDNETRDNSSLNRKNMLSRLIKILQDKEIWMSFTSAEQKEEQ